MTTVPVASADTAAPTSTVTAMAATTFAHPSVLFTQADFDRMAAKVAAGAQPWAAGWNALISDGYSQINATPRPLQTVIRGGTGENFNQMVIDMERTYQLAVRWKVSGDSAFANQAVTYLNSWSSTMTTLTGNADRFLASGLYGFGWAAAADIMRSYSGWASADVTQFQSYLVNIYYPMEHDFLVNHNTASITNYWANWDLANLEGMMAIGIFADRHDLYDEAINYLYNGGGNGAMDKMVYFMHPGNLAQWQESGRDQGHSVLGMQLFGHIAQMAWQQGDDLFAYNNFQFLAAAEYIAKYNLGNDVPYESYEWGTGQSGTWSIQPGISSASRGDLDVGYELIYAHYHDLLGMAAPYSAARIAARGTEWRGSGDDFGFGTLTYRLDPVGTGLIPKVTAREKGAGNIELDWYGTSNATGYNVYRSTNASGPYTQIAGNVTDLLTYTDANLPAGVYYYKIRGITSTGETGDSNIVRATSTSLLQTQLLFDENAGTTTVDATGNGSNGTLNGGATWTTGKTGAAVALNGANGYVSLPPGVVAGLNDFTISTWVYLNSAATWSRIFDFGDSRGRWMMLTPRNANGQVEFATSTVYGYNKQWVAGSAALPTNQWVNVTVTLADHVGTIYVNGVAVGSNANMDFAPFQFASTANNWLGRSEYASDPYLNGKIDDFRIYRGSLTAAEVGLIASASVPSAPTGVTASAGDSQVTLDWTAAPGATGYNVKRAVASGGPYVRLASSVSGTSYIDSTAVNGATYYYVVSAVNIVGEGANSSEVTAMPALIGPTVATPAKATPSPVSGTTTVLSMLGADDKGESNLTYSWSTVGTPPAAVSFSENGTNSAKSVTASFSKAGTYDLTVTVTDSDGLTTLGSVTVQVAQTLSSIAILPTGPTVLAGGTQQITASATDQFGQSMTFTPTWTATGGAISTSGLYTAGNTPGAYSVTATSGLVSRSVSVTVVSNSIFTGQADIGTVGLAGSYRLNGSVYSVKGAGSDIWGSADSFHFVYVPFSGDGQFVARVAGMQNTNSSAKAGIMMRENLTIGSRNVFMGVTPSTATFQRRTAASSSTSRTNKSGVTAPYWVKLVRSGNVFQAFYSANGSTWTQLGSNTTIAMASGIYVGLAVTSHATAALNTSTFDNVSITPFTNLATGKTITASSTAIGSAAANAVDTSTTTAWTSASAGSQTLSVDLGASKAVSHIKLIWGASYAKSYSVQVSSNASTWTTLFSTTSGTGGTVDIAGLLTPGRYVRMLLNSSNSTSYVLADLAAFGV